MECNAMYAQHSYAPRQPRTVGLGAAFLINGAVIAGIGFFLAPKFVRTPPPNVLIGEQVPLDPVPPPLPEPKPKTEPRTSQQPLPNAPTPLIRSETTNTATATDVIPPQPPLPPTAEKVGPEPVIAEPIVPPLPPLIAAAQDPRYLKDFQPDYPASELRAQRDGQVSVRILIGTDGRVKAIEQVRATSTAFFEATRRQALGKWRFKPATRGGVPQESWKVMNVRFELANQ
jgi:protein TonB